ncbi:transmembrane emp24 domain-containing protein p24delta9-like [Rutidosis leptorrhynchoides]|uniref:transmembrane emp24 domain-containing protein p24delta9-like n=1 Tax=Rutidosis leptorrhynchoides TaxID=125765 RepID=UPI003A9A31E2
MELRMVVFMILILSMLIFCNVAHSLRFDIESDHTKCMTEDIRKDSLTIGQYSVINPNQNDPFPEHHKIAAMLFSPKGNRVHYAEDVVLGQFVLDVEEDGSYMACFSAVIHKPPVNISVDFNWRSGVDAKDWSNVAKKNSVEAMELELKKMEDIVTSIHIEMFLLRKRQQMMQELNGNTNSTMGYLSLGSLFICLSVAGLQLWHLKSFFQKRKII